MAKKLLKNFLVIIDNVSKDTIKKCNEGREREIKKVLNQETNCFIEGGDYLEPVGNKIFISTK